MIIASSVRHPVTAPPVLVSPLAVPVPGSLTLVSLTRTVTSSTAIPLVLLGTSGEMVVDALDEGTGPPRVPTLLLHNLAAALDVLLQPPQVPEGLVLAANSAEILQHIGLLLFIMVQVEVELHGVLVPTVHDPLTDQAYDSS